MIVNNLDSFDWTNCELELNSPLFSSGYVLHVARIPAGKEQLSALLNFAKTDGERFDPYQRKPQNVTISCDTPSGRGSYYGGWQ